MKSSSLLILGVLSASLAGIGAFALWSWLQTPVTFPISIGSAIIAVNEKSEIRPEAFSVLDGDFVLDCRDSECRTGSFTDKKRWWEMLGTWWSKDAASKVKAQTPTGFIGTGLQFPPDAIVIRGSDVEVNGSGTVTRNQTEGTIVIPDATTFNFEFSIASSNIYTAYLSVQNADVNNILSAPRCNGQNDSECIPDNARSFIFSNIFLKNESTQARKELGSNTVSATNSPQAVQIPLGLLESGDYIITVQWNNDFEKSVAAVGGGEIVYRLSLQVNGLVVSPPTTQLSEDRNSNGEDVIGIRAYSNPEYLTLLEWYQKNVPNPGNPIVTTINGFPALNDQGTIYIMGFNIIEKEKLETWGLTPIDVSVPNPQPPNPPEQGENQVQ